MAETPKVDLTGKLLAPAFTRAGADVRVLPDPIADTPMVVTLDQLKPYNLDPRITRNPRYEDIKSSIRERGLDAPPAITRRPGEEHFIIRNGGNTRLAILHQLWTETRDERFFRIPCLFRPWSARGEVVLLTGHLSENELRGALSFIERALGVEKARELYEAETGSSLTQTELAQRLTSDGYPVTQSHISRMQDAVRYLLPAIPTVLYGGLGKPQIERLTALRKVAARVWERHAQLTSVNVEFTDRFQEVLSLFDGDPNTFNVQRVQDELIGQMAQLFHADYDTVALELIELDTRHRALSQEPMFHVKPDSQRGGVERAPSQTSDRSHSSIAQTPQTQQPTVQRNSVPTDVPPAREASPTQLTRATSTPNTDSSRVPKQRQDDAAERLQSHIVSPAQSTDRLQAIQRTIAEATGEPVSDFKGNVVQAIPVQAGGLHPISDVWYIEPALDVPDRLRILIAQLAREIAQEAGIAPCIESTQSGIGFLCARTAPPSAHQPPSLTERAVLALLNALSAPFVLSVRSGVERVRLAEDLAALLLGVAPARRAAPSSRLSDASLVKFFRLIRLSRRLIDLESTSNGSLAPDGAAPHR